MTRALIEREWAGWRTQEDLDVHESRLACETEDVHASLSTSCQVSLLEASLCLPSIMYKVVTDFGWFYVGRL